MTAMVFTLDEELNLPRCLDSLAWCDDVIVIDSFSTDRTEAICKEKGARFYQHAFEGFGSQRNWAVDNCAPKHAWILMLDADERTTDELVDAIQSRKPGDELELAVIPLEGGEAQEGRAAVQCHGVALSASVVKASAKNSSSARPASSLKSRPSSSSIV